MLSRILYVGLMLLLLVPQASYAGINSIVKNGDLGFGRFVSFSSSGTITVSSAGSRSSVGGVAMLNGGTIAAASYTLTGSKNSNYTISLPANNTVSIILGGSTLTLTNFTCSIPLKGKLGTNNTTMTFTVGATATVSPNTTPGNYSGSFNISAN